LAFKPKAKDFTFTAKAKAKDLALKAKFDDSKFVVEDTSRLRTKAKDDDTGFVALELVVLCARRMLGADGRSSNDSGHWYGSLEDNALPGQRLTIHSGTTRISHLYLSRGHEVKISVTRSKSGSRRGWHHVIIIASSFTIAVSMCKSVLPSQRTRRDAVYVYDPSLVLVDQYQ